jgi:hypothetical protein
MNRKFFVAALALVALTSISSLRASAQSCQTFETFGTRQLLAVNKSVQSQIEVTYFTTDDPNAFISEKAGFKHSASYMSLSANQFVAKLSSLQRDGLATIRKQQSATSYLGEVAEMNLERDAVKGKAGMINASHASTSNLNALDRKTDINVYEALSNESGYYRVSLLSWFVNAKANKVVDYDAIVLLKPGQTAVFKLGSDYEVKRSGSARSYIAVTMRSVGNASVASLAHRR